MATAVVSGQWPGVLGGTSLARPSAIFPYLDPKVAVDFRTEPRFNIVFSLGGPLQNEYKIENFHFHWGSDNSCGSEHLLEGKSFAAEVHVVHYNTVSHHSP